MIRLIILLLIGTVVCPAFAQQTVEEELSGYRAKPDEQRMTVENIQKKTEIVRDPGLAVDNAQRALANENSVSEPESVSTSTMRVVATLEEDRKRIDDPTQMTGSFSQALHRIKSGQGAAAPAPPNVFLAAKAICQGNNKSALLKVAGQIRMVREGNKFSFLENKQFYEILVNKIEPDHVVITLLPMGIQMVLQ